jgi:Ras-related protein Rab-1A
MGCSVSTANTDPIRTAPLSLSRRSQDYDMLFKLLLVGESGVGKSSILTRYVDETFNDAFISTIGVDFRIRSLKYKGMDVKLQIWDTAGQERFRTIVSSYYRGAQGVFVVFDVGNRMSFDGIPEWLQNIDRLCKDDVVKILVGNKADLKHRMVKESEGRQFAKENDMYYIETSAKSAINIDHAFELMCDQLTK